MRHSVTWLPSAQIWPPRMFGRADGLSLSTDLVTSARRAPACRVISVRIVQARPRCPISDPQFPSVTASHLFTLSSLGPVPWRSGAQPAWIRDAFSAVVNK